MASDINPANFLQIWIFPEKKDVEPVYNQEYFDIDEAQGKWQKLVAKENAPLQINQQACISRVQLKQGQTISYTADKHSFGNYLFVIDGSIQTGDYILEKRDGAGIEENKIEIKALKDSYLINIEV